MRRKIYSSTSRSMTPRTLSGKLKIEASSIDSDVRAKLMRVYQSEVDKGNIPEVGSIIKTEWDGIYEYWEVFCIDGLDGAIDEFLYDEDVDILSSSLEDEFAEFIYNKLWVKSLPADPYGGTPLCDFDSWEPSSFEEANEDSFGIQR